MRGDADDLVGNPPRRHPAAQRREQCIVAELTVIAGCTTVSAVRPISGGAADHRRERYLAARARRLRAGSLPAARRVDRRAAHGGADVTAPPRCPLPGLAGYLERVEALLAETVAAHPGVVSAVGADALAAGGKRLRPTLTFLASAPGAPSRWRKARRSSSSTWPRCPRRHRRRRARAPRAGRRLDGPGAEAAKAAGDHLFAAAFALLAREGTHEQVTVLADASLALARGEALQRRQRHDPETTVEAYLERCGLKTGSLFAAACTLGGGSATFGRLLGIAFQIVDDVLDCTGETVETGKVPGTDLRDGTPTLPLLLAAREDEVVRRALEGGPLEGALVRVAATDALERSRTTALEIAEQARESLDGAVRRAELEAVVDVVLERTR